MTNIEKTIKGLEACSTGKCTVACPYHNTSQCTRVILYDALELLKKQQEEIEDLKSTICLMEHEVL